MAESTQPVMPTPDSGIELVGKQPQMWVPGTFQDPARYLINPGQVTAPGKYSAGNFAFARPSIANGPRMFVFPVGVESFRRSGNAQVGVHHYVGAYNAAGITVQYEEGHIELSGIFPGITSVNKMQACLEVLKSKQRGGLVLYLPGIFDNQQYVLAETWDFNHDPDDRTHSINYTMSFLILGEGKKIANPKGKPPAPNPTTKTRPKGKRVRIFFVKEGVRTFKQIAYRVYKNSNRYVELVPLNQPLVNRFMKARPGASTPAMYELPTHRWPLGTKIYY